MEKTSGASSVTDEEDEMETFRKPMHVAAIRGDVKAIVSLKKSNRKVDELENGQTPLHLAVVEGKTRAVRKLISLGADLSKMNKDGFTALHLSVIRNRLSLIDLLIDRDSECGVDTPAGNGNAPLHIAAGMGHVNAVRTLLDKGAYADHPNREGNTPLHLAIILGNTNVINALLGYTVNPNVINKAGYRPLHLAVLHNRVDIIRKIGRVENFVVNYHNGKGDSALHLAAELGNLEAIQELCKLDAYVNLRNVRGYTPLHVAVMFEKLSAIKTLLRCRADINRGDRYGFTPVHLAVKHKKIGSLKLLCQLGANVDIKNVDGDSPLHSAMVGDCKCILPILLSFGALVNVFNFKDMTPLHYAACLGNSDGIEMLSRYEGILHISNTAGDTPLHSAAKFCNAVGMYSILKFGAKINLKNKAGLTALDIIMSYVREGTSQTVMEALAERYSKLDLIRTAFLCTHEILKAAMLILKFEILNNLKHTKLNEPEYMSNISPNLKYYIKDCSAEVQLMANTWLHENFSLNSFVISGWDCTRPLTCAYTSEVALNCILDVSATKGYPIYRDLIASHLDRPTLLKKARCLIMFVRPSRKTIVVDSLAVRNITGHLDNEDILNLLIAYSGLDPHVDVSESSNGNKRKLSESNFDSNSENKKSDAMCSTTECTKAQLSGVQKPSKKSRSSMVNFSNEISSCMITRSMKASNSKTTSNKDTQFPEI